MFFASLYLSALCCSSNNKKAEILEKYFFMQLKTCKDLKKDLRSIDEHLELVKNAKNSDIDMDISLGLDDVARDAFSSGGYKMTAFDAYYCKGMYSSIHNDTKHYAKEMNSNPNLATSSVDELMVIQRNTHKRYLVAFDKLIRIYNFMCKKNLAYAGWRYYIAN